MKNEDILSEKKNLSLKIISEGKIFLFRKIKILFEKSLFHSCRKKETDIKETFIFVPKKKREENFYFAKKEDQMKTFSLKKKRKTEIKEFKKRLFRKKLFILKKKRERNFFVLNKYI